MNHADCLICLNADARHHGFDFLLWKGELREHEDVNFFDKITEYREGIDK